MKRKDIFSLKIVFLIGGLLLLFLSYFFRQTPDTNKKTTEYTKPYSEPSQISEDMVTIKKDESESMIGSPTSRIEPSEIPAEETQPLQKGELFLVVLGAVTLHLERADSEYAQTHGLTGRTFLPKNEGILYIVTKRQEFSYWAQDMRFATDVIWIDPDFRIVDISKNITPDSYPDSIFRSKEPARYVIEVNAGVADMAGVRIGDSLDLSHILKK